MTQDIIMWVIVAACVAAAAYFVWRSVASRKSRNSGCAGCPVKDACSGGGCHK